MQKKSSWVDQLQENLLENDDHNQLDDNKKLEEKNFQSLIYEKLVALLLEWHFAKAASTQLLGNEAWKKSREASQTSFDKVGDKELLQEELRRQELGYKDLWPAYCRALCPTSFEENSFTEETFTNTSLGKETFTEKSFNKNSFADTSFTEETFTENSFKESSLTSTSLTKSTLTENSFAKNSLTKKSFDQPSFSENTSLEDSFSENSLENKTLTEQLRTQQLGGLELPLGSFDDSSFEESSFTQSSLEESSFTKSSFPTSSLRESSFNKESFAHKSFQRRSFNHSSLEESSFTKSSFEKSSLEENSFNESSFTKSSFQQSSFEESSLEASSFNQRSFEESSFAQSSLEESSLKTGSFEQSSLETNSFELSDFEATSFTESSFQEASFTTATTFSTELSEPQRSSLSTELSALHLELEELDGRALKKAASSLEGASFLLPGGSRPETAWPQGGVLTGEACLPAYSLTHLCPCGSSVLPGSLKRSFLFLSLAEPENRTPIWRIRAKSRTKSSATKLCTTKSASNLQPKSSVNLQDNTCRAPQRVSKRSRGVPPEVSLLVAPKSVTQKKKSNQKSVTRFWELLEPNNLGNQGRQISRWNARWIRNRLNQCYENTTNTPRNQGLKPKKNIGIGGSGRKSLPQQQQQHNNKPKDDAAKLSYAKTNK